MKLKMSWSALQTYFQFPTLPSLIPAPPLSRPIQTLGDGVLSLRYQVSFSLRVVQLLRWCSQGLQPPSSPPEDRCFPYSSLSLHLRLFQRISLYSTDSLFDLTISAPLVGSQSVFILCFAIPIICFGCAFSFFACCVCVCWLFFRVNFTRKYWLNRI